MMHCATNSRRRAEALIVNPEINNHLFIHIHQIALAIVNVLFIIAIITSEKYWYSFSKDSINTQNIAANMLLHKDVMMKQK